MTTPSHPVVPLDDDDFPAYTMGRAAELIGSTPAFLRALGEARLITPLRSDGGHRRYSRYQLRIASRARDLVDAGTPIEAACRIIILEDQLEEALRLNAGQRRPRNPLTGHRHLIAPVAGAATAVVHVRRRSPEAIRPGPRGKIDLAATEASVDATRASPLVTCSARPGDVRTVRTVVSARRGLGSGV